MCSYPSVEKHLSRTHGHRSADKAILNSLVIGETKIPTNQKQLFVAWSEEEMQSRLVKFKAAKQLQQLETIHLVTSPNGVVQRRNQINFSGSTTAGNVLSNAPLCNLNTGWILPFSVQKDLYGSMRMAVGGASDAGTVPERKDDIPEPVAWHQTSTAVWQELMRSETQAGCVVDWTPMDVLPWECLIQGVPYIGICYSAKHVELLYERLSTLMLHQMKEEGKWYRPEFARVMKVVPTAKKAAAKAKGEQKDQKGGKDQKEQQKAKTKEQKDDEKEEKAAEKSQAEKNARTRWTQRPRKPKRR